MKTLRMKRSLVLGRANLKVRAFGTLSSIGLVAWPLRSCAPGLAKLLSGELEPRALLAVPGYDDGPMHWHGRGRRPV